MDTKRPRNLPSNILNEEPSEGIPTDVTFQIMGHTDADHEGADVLLGEVTGHKLLLAMFSPVFKRGFFGPAKEGKDVIPVRETTLEAFKLLVDYIYNRDIDWELSVAELYDVVNLAEKYQIPGLMEEVKKKIETCLTIDLSLETVLDIADLATQFSHFPSVSDPILAKCSKYLKSAVGAPWKILNYTGKLSGSGQEETIVKLLSLMCLKCPSCKQVKCQNGKLLDTQDKFIPGCKIIINRENSYWGANSGDLSNHLLTVVSLAKNNQVKVTNIVGTVKTYYTSFLNNNDTVPTFCYKCDY